MILYGDLARAAQLIDLVSEGRKRRLLLKSVSLPWPGLKNDHSLAGSQHSVAMPRTLPLLITYLRLYPWEGIAKKDGSAYVG